MSLKTIEPLRTIEQRRAQFAYGKIEDVKNSGNKNYKSLVRGFASTILLNGLGQALAFLKAKKKDHHLALYNHINLWAKKHFKKQDGFDILNAIGEEASSSYRLYTKETLAFLVWLRKFAEAELPDKE